MFKLLSFLASVHKINALPNLTNNPYLSAVASILALCLCCRPLLVVVRVWWVVVGGVVVHTRQWYRGTEGTSVGSNDML